MIKLPAAQSILHVSHHALEERAVVSALLERYRMAERCELAVAFERVVHESIAVEHHAIIAREVVANVRELLL